LLQVGLRLGLQMLGQLAEHLGRLVHPAPLRAGRAKYLWQRFPETERTIADGQLGIVLQTASLHIQQHFFPRLLGFTKLIGERHQLLLALGRGPHHHQDALIGFLHPHPEVNAIDP